jgi:hypothetical protein
MHLDNSISLRIYKETREMSERGVAYLKVLTSMSKNARVSLEPANKYL